MKFPADLIERVKAAHDIVEVIGHVVDLKRAGGSWKGLCPFHEEKTPSFDVRQDRQTFKCFGCGKRGDVITWTQEQEGTTFLQAVRSLAAEKGIALPVAGVQARLTRVAAPRQLQKSTTQLLRPPADELESLLSSCRTVPEDEEVAGWIRSRGCDPEAVALETDVCSIPKGILLPSWARSRFGPWNATGHRCAFPLYDETGRCVAVRARALVAIGPDQRKSLVPCGFRSVGLVIADIVGRQILEGHPPEGWDGSIIIVEGEPDFLSWVTRRRDSCESVPAVLGIYAGAWTEAIGARIPDGTPIAIRNHADMPGQRYAAEVAKSLKGRCVVSTLAGSHA